MRWQMVDHIDYFEPWHCIEGRKNVSLEEGYLLERFGRSGILSEGILVESMVQLGRWLVLASSNFLQSALLDEIASLRIESIPSMGDALSLSARAEAVEGDLLPCCMTVQRQACLVAEGRMVLRLMESNNLVRANTTPLLWRELYGKA